MALYIDKPMHEYLEDLAAKKPSPGGGSAAALSASIGASLMCMVANYTVGNPIYKDVEMEVADIMMKVSALRSDLEGLIDDDVKAYETLSAAMKKFKKRSAQLDKAYKDAIRPPYEVCRIADELLKLCERLSACGNKNLITDTAIAAIMLEGAFFSAKYNVYENLKYVDDIDFIGQAHKFLSPLEESVPKLKEDILEKCEEAIAR